MGVKCFYFLIITVSFFSQVHGALLEQSAVKTVRFATRACALYRYAKQPGENIQYFSKRFLTTTRGIHTKFPSGNYSLHDLSTSGYQSDKRGKHFGWCLLAGASAAVLSSAVVSNEAYTDGEVSFNPSSVKGRDLTEEELEQCLLEGYKRIEDGYKVLKHREKKDSVFIIGNTGSGKSILSLYLNIGKKPILGITDNGRDIATFKGYETLVGDDPNESCTLYPRLGFAGDIALWDCPGFKDTRGENARLAASVFLDYLTRRGEGGRFLVVVEDSTLYDGKGDSFSYLLKDILNLLTNSEGVFFDSTDDKESLIGSTDDKGSLIGSNDNKGSLLDSIVWVVTKSSRKPDHLKNEIQDKMSRKMTLAKSIAAEISVRLAKFLKGEDTEAGRAIFERKETIYKENLLIRSLANNYVQLTFNNDQCREDILSRIRKARLVFGVRSTFVDSKQREKLVDFSERTFERALEFNQESEKLMQEQEELTKSLQIKRQLKDLDQTGFLKLVADEIRNIKNQKKERKEIRLEIERDLDALQQQDKEVLVWEESKFQRRTRLIAGVFNPVFSTFKFDYDNPEKPFVRVEVEKDDFTEQTSCLGDGVNIPISLSPTVAGSKAFLHKGDVPRHSATYTLVKPSTRFSATYEGGRGRECRVNVKLYSEKSKLQITGAVKELSDKKLLEVDNEVEKFDKNLRFLEHLQDVAKDKGLKEARKILEKSENDLGSELKLATLIGKSDKKKHELKKKRDIGFALLAMGPKHLHENPMAQAFKKQFREEGEV